MLPSDIVNRSFLFSRAVKACAVTANVYTLMPETKNETYVRRTKNESVAARMQYGFLDPLLG
jgi:hypothetical protein